MDDAFHSVAEFVFYRPIILCMYVHHRRYPQSVGCQGSSFIRQYFPRWDLLMTAFDSTYQLLGHVCIISEFVCVCVYFIIGLFEPF